MMAKRKKAAALVSAGPAEYGGLVTGIADLLEQACAVNDILTTMANSKKAQRPILAFGEDES